MSDRPLQLTAQELIYAAAVLRAEARRAERETDDPGYEPYRALFERTAETHRTLAGKLTRIAERVRT